MANPSTAAKRVNPMLAATWIAPEEAGVDAPEASETGAPMGVASTPESTGVPSSGVTTSLAPIARAADMYAAKVLPVVGALILPTIPNPQCETCLQKYQMGFVSVMLRVKVDEANKVESNPAEAFVEAFAARYVHGFAKFD